jgi:hypothetical protein
MQIFRRLTRRPRDIVPIKVGTEVIGAVGVSGAPGGEKDEVCANAGIAKVEAALKQITATGYKTRGVAARLVLSFLY